MQPNIDSFQTSDDAVSGKYARQIIYPQFDFEALLLDRGFRHADGVLARMPHSGGYTAIYVRGEIAIAVTIVKDRTYPLPGPRVLFQLYPGSEYAGYFEAGFSNESPRWQHQPIPCSEVKADIFINKLNRLVREKAVRAQPVSLLTSYEAAPCLEKKPIGQLE